jgi:gas vesicle protein
MTTLLRFRNVFLAAALLAAPAACKKSNDTANQADRAADRVKDHADDLRDEARDVKETADNRRDDLRDETTDRANDATERRNDLADKANDTARDVADETSDVGKEAKDLQTAQVDFQTKRANRIATLRAIHGLAASQPMLINALVTSLPIVDTDRALVNEKLQIFQMRVDEAGNQIQTLQTVEAQSWEQRHDDVNKAMDRLEDARKDAWDALDDAKRLDRTSMR